MKSKYIDFIGMYENVFPEGYCEHMIDEFENKLICGHCANRKDTEQIPRYKKDDEFYFLNVRPHLYDKFGDKGNSDTFFEGLQNCFDEYSNEYDILKDRNIFCSEAKVQKTKPGGGYHIWHFEQDANVSASTRILTYIAYLNTLEPDCAGETELLYQKMRIPPQKNSLIIFPASYTHTHRGNVVFGEQSKYIITGWFHLA